MTYSSWRSSRMLWLLAKPSKSTSEPKPSAWQSSLRNSKRALVTYEIRIGQRVRKEMARLPRREQARILSAIKGLADNPRPTGCTPVRMAEKGTYRVRVGNYRVIYVVLDDEGVVLIARVTRRSESTYRGLR